MEVCRRDHPWGHRSWSADEVPKVGDVVRTRATVMPEHYADREAVVVEVRDLDHGVYEIGLELSGAHARTWFTPDELTTPAPGPGALSEGAVTGSSTTSTTSPLVAQSHQLPPAGATTT